MVRNHVEVMLVAIVAVSLIPVVIEALRARRSRTHQPGRVPTDQDTPSDSSRNR